MRRKTLSFRGCWIHSRCPIHIPFSPFFPLGTLPGSHGGEGSWLTSWVWKSNRPGCESRLRPLLAGCPRQAAHLLCASVAEVGGWGGELPLCITFVPDRGEEQKGEVGKRRLDPAAPFPSSWTGWAPPLTAVTCDLQLPAHCLAQPPAPSSAQPRLQPQRRAPGQLQWSVNESLTPTSFPLVQGASPAVGWVPGQSAVGTGADAE